MNLITHLRQRSILDVGMGIGSYGFLCAAAYDSQRLWKEGRKNEAFRLDAVEGFPEYVGVVQEAIYDDIMVGDFLDHLPTLVSKEYDLLLLVDVLEHVEEKELEAALSECRRVSRSTIVSTPLQFAHQHDLDENHLQDHLSHPTRRNLRKEGLDLLVPDDASLIMFGSDDKAFLEYYRRRLRRTRIRSALPARAIPYLGRLRALARAST